MIGQTNRKTAITTLYIDTSLESQLCLQTKRFLLNLESQNQARNTTVVLPSAQIKFWGKSI